MKNISANILLIAFDDDTQELEIFEDILKENNVSRYLLFSKKEDFFSNLNADINLVILDHDLVFTTGLETTREVKKRNKDNYVIIVSGVRSFDVAVEYLNAGADKFVKREGDATEYRKNLVEALREGFQAAQQRKDLANEINEYKRSKDEQLNRYTTKLIEIIERGKK